VRCKKKFFFWAKNLSKVGLIAVFNRQKNRELTFENSYLLPLPPLLAKFSKDGS